MASTNGRLDAPLLERARRSLRRRDASLAAVIRDVGPCQLDPTGRPYDSLIRSVLHQQLAGAAARSIEARLKAAYRGRFPRPAALLATTQDALRLLGLSRQKTAALHGIAQAFAEGRLSSRGLASADDEAVVEQLTQIRGVGRWTADMILIFSLGRPDVLPVGDYGIRKGARAVYGLHELPGPAELESLATRWRPYRTVASWYLWRAADGLGREAKGPRGGRGRGGAQ